MSYGGKELASAFRTVRKNTIQIAEEIPESSYGFSPAPDVRSVGHLLTHIAISTRIWLELNKNLRLTTLVGLISSRFATASWPRKTNLAPKLKFSGCSAPKAKSSLLGWKRLPRNS